MRAELEKIIGAAALDERAVRDMWPLGLMEERAGQHAPSVLVARPFRREQVSAILRWATATGVVVTPMGGGTGVCGALAPQAASWFST
jgi:FAD/FMN-containing dehydrogenase